MDDFGKQQIYLETWRDSLIPLCTNSSQSAPHLCSEFKPSLSDHGMCFTKNQAPVDTIYRPTEYMKTFKEAFLSDRDDFTILKNRGSGKRYKTIFLINANQVMDMRNGLKWNRTDPSEFLIGIHPNLDMPIIRETGIKIDAGFKTMIRVNAIQLKSDKSIKRLDVRRRGCKFREESKDMSIFKVYSRYCVFRYYLPLSYCNFLARDTIKPGRDCNDALIFFHQDRIVSLIAT